MGTRLRNEAQVRRYLLGHDKIVAVVDYILDKITETNKEIIEEVVYGAYDPTTYERTFEFRDAWGAEKARASGIHVKGEFKYMPDTMHYVPEKAQHGSPSFYIDPESGNRSSHGKFRGDAREYLAEIIYEGLSGPLFGEGAWTSKRNAWEVLMKRLGKATMNQWIREGFARVGLNIKTHHGVSVQ